MKGFKIYFLLCGQFDILHEGYHDPHYCINEAPSLITGIVIIGGIVIFREITSTLELQYADWQATKFRRGDFLTRHIDNVPGETKRIAYVLGLTEDWHPDWGGLLQFFEKDGTPTRSWSSAINSLILFNVDKVHSVRPFALKNRYSITGWFRR
ncbi:MAG: Rps23 Pro-64 3,4-dihydroxylase Tpa1-like proline 4-hydroxylase [Cognaticolwellia sp.]